MRTDDGDGYMNGERGRESRKWCRFAHRIGHENIVSLPG